MNTTQEIEAPKDQAREDAIRNFVEHQSRSRAAVIEGTENLRKFYSWFFQDIAAKVSAIQKLESSIVSMSDHIASMEELALQAFTPASNVASHSTSGMVPEVKIGENEKD